MRSPVEVNQAYGRLLLAQLAFNRGLLGTARLGIVCGLDCAFSMFPFVLFMHADTQLFFRLHS